MRTVLTAALAYRVVVFTAGVALGTLRVTLLDVAIGPLAAVACELPLMLLVACWGARWVLRRWPLQSRSGRLAMGATAFAVLIGAGAALARMAFGQSLADRAGQLATAPGALGLAGQVAITLIASFAPKYPRG